MSIDSPPEILIRECFLHCVFTNRQRTNIVFDFVVRLSLEVVRGSSYSNDECDCSSGTKSGKRCNPAALTVAVYANPHRVDVGPRSQQLNSGERVIGKSFERRYVPVTRRLARTSLVIDQTRNSTGSEKIWQTGEVLASRSARSMGGVQQAGRYKGKTMTEADVTLSNPEIGALFQNDQVLKLVKSEVFQQAMRDNTFRELQTNREFLQLFQSDAFQQLMASDAYEQLMASDAYHQIMASDAFYHLQASDAYRALFANDSYRAILASDAYHQLQANDAYRAILSNDAFLKVLANDSFREIMMGLLRLRAELGIKAKGILLMREAGFQADPDPSLQAKLEEVNYLEKSIGKTGMRALKPFVDKSSQDLWQLNLLDGNQ